MREFFRQLLFRPEIEKSRLIRFTENCGYMYILIGSLFLFVPNSLVMLGLTPTFQGQEEGLIRIVGITVAIIGYFYIFGARTHSRAFGLSTILDRLLIPFLLSFVYLVSNVELFLLLPLGVLDPVLALIALYLWKNYPEDFVGESDNG